MNKTLKGSGFTLAECMVILCLLGVLAAFALPNFTNRLGRDDADMVVNWVVLNVAHFKMEARQRRRVLQLCYANDTHEFQVRSEETTDGELEILAKHPLPESLEVVSVCVNSKDIEDLGSCIHFYPRGYSDDARIDMIDNHDRQWSLLVHPFLSRVAVYDGGYPTP